MKTAEFLRRILPPSGDWYCWCTPAPANDPKGRRYIQRFTKHISHIVEGVHQCDANKQNTYYAMASFTERGTRKQDNVAFLKSFWIDIDCGEAKAAEGKGYATKREGAAALFKATISAGLPMPLVVDSGNGLHAYWPLTEAVAADVWRPVAHRLVAAYQQEGLIADWGCSADHSRILRAIGTHNWKNLDQPKDVVLKLDCPDYPLSRIEGPLEGIVVALPASRSNDLGVNSDLGMPEEAPSSLPDQVAEKCAQVGRFKELNGCLPEPEWRGGLSILKSCVDGEVTAHQWSSGYPLYQFTETQEKLDQIKGPYTCATFERYNPSGCEGCVHKGKITSPIQLGRPEPEEITEEEVVEDEPLRPSVAPKVVDGKVMLPTMPGSMRGYAWTDQGMTVKQKDADGEMKQVPFTDAFMYCEEKITVPGVGEVLRFQVQKRRNRGLTTFDLPTACVYAKDQLLKAVATAGIGPFAGKDKEFVMFIQKWFDTARAHARETQQHRHYGWQDSGGFLVGNRLFLPNQPMQIVAVGGDAHTALGMMSQSGDRAEWSRLVNEAYSGAGQEQYQFILACSFGAPLMRFTPQKGVTVDMVSAETGVGKTTAAKAALSVWGNPDDMALTCGQTTINAIFARMSLMSSLPCYMDEVTKASADMLSKLAYDVTSGKPKDRLQQSGAMKVVEEGWTTIMLASGNTSMSGRIATARMAADAEMGRVFEFRMDPSLIDHDKASEARARFNALAKCYGTAGDVYAQYLVDNVDVIQKMIDRVMNRIEKRAHTETGERYWLAGVAAAITGAQIATKLQLVDFNVNALLDWAVERIVESRSAVAAATRTPDETFATMLNELSGGVIHTDTLGTIETLAPLVANNRLPNKIVGRRITDQRMLWLSVEAAKRWCADNNADYGAMIEAAKASGRIVGSTAFNLGAFTDAATIPTKCLMITQDG